jgi:hypothetical protein
LRSLAKQCVYRAAITIGVAMLACSAVARESSAEHSLAQALPACAKSAQSGVNPHPNCVLRPWITNEAIPISGTVKVTKAAKRLGGWFYVFTVTTAYSNPKANICPGGAVPYSLIPCHYAGISSGIVGQSVPGAKTLASPFASALEYDPCVPRSPCVRHYQVSASMNYGRMTFVVQVTQGSVTRAANDLGTAGFEQAITVNVPRYTGKPPACLALGKC